MLMFLFFINGENPMKIKKIASSSLKATKRLAMVGVVATTLVACSSTPSSDDAASSADAADADSGSAVTTTAIDDGATSTEIDPATLESVVYFGFDLSSLTSTSRAVLDAQAAYLRNSGVSVRLEGHADERGSREYNMALGERRAQAVADYLAIQGVPRSNMEVISYGEERPAALQSNESAYALNRRVEIK